jgi:hypothetical protein
LKPLEYIICYQEGIPIEEGSLNINQNENTCSYLDKSFKIMPLIFKTHTDSFNLKYRIADIPWYCCGYKMDALYYNLWFQISNIKTWLWTGLCVA